MKWLVRGVGDAREVEVERSAGGFSVTIDGRQRSVDMLCLNGIVASLRFTEDGSSYPITYQHHARRGWRVAVGDREFDLTVLTPVEAVENGAGSAGGGPSRIEAPIPGKVVAVQVAVGDEVEPGKPLVVLEAMKMENELTAEQPGRVAAVHVAPGQTVDRGAPLVDLE
jgi:biotin carboxyl carrier protein